MNKLWIVSKNEFYRYFASPLAYVYLISFLLLNGSFAIYFGHFFEIGQAGLLPMFSFQPWLYLLFGLIFASYLTHLVHTLLHQIQIHRKILKKENA